MGENSDKYPECVEGIHYHDGQPVPVCIKIKDGKIEEIYSIAGSPESLPIVAPGLVDLQVNGYGGVDFNTIPFTEEDVLKAVTLLAQQGVTNFCPTLITNNNDAIKQAIKTINKACKKYPEVKSAIIGIHIEGPFISKEDGPRGAHNLDFVQAPDWELFQEWQNIAKGKIKILTLSPEWENAPEFIKKCVESGVIVSIGHTAASPEQIIDAVNAGASLSTHLGNAAHLMLPRHPNYIWEQMAQERLWASVIADGFHLPDSFLKVVFKMKSKKSILISDCTQFTGLPPGTYQSHIGGKVTLNNEGRLCLADKPALLAGSAQSLLWCINQVVKKNLLMFEEAWEKASLKPLELLCGKPLSAFQIGEPANLVLFEQNNKKIKILQTLLAGKVLFNHS